MISPGFLPSLMRGALRPDVAGLVSGGGAAAPETLTGLTVGEQTFTRVPLTGAKDYNLQRVTVDGRSLIRIEARTGDFNAGDVGKVRAGLDGFPTDRSGLVYDKVELTRIDDSPLAKISGDYWTAIEHGTDVYPGDVQQGGHWKLTHEFSDGFGAARTRIARKKPTYDNAGVLTSATDVSPHLYDSPDAPWGVWEFWTKNHPTDGVLIVKKDGVEVLNYKGPMGFGDRPTHAQIRAYANERGYPIAFLCDPSDFSSTSTPFVQPAYPAENAVVLADMRRVASITQTGTAGGTSNVVAGGFPPFGVDGVQITLASSDKTLGPTSNRSPVNCSAAGGAFRIWFRPISGVSAIAGGRFVLELSSNAVSDVTNFVRCSQFNTSADMHLRTTAKNDATAGRWQAYSIPVANINETAGTGANLAAITSARVKLRGTAAVLEGFVIEYVPPQRLKAACIWTGDDGKLSHLNYVAPKLAEYGWAGVAFPSPAAGIGVDGTVMTFDQLRILQNTYGWQIGAQAYLDEDAARVEALTYAAQLAEYAQIDALWRAEGLHGYPARSFYSLLSQKSMPGYQALRDSGRNIRTFYNGADGNPPFFHGETFPFGDRYAYRAMNLSSGWGANTTTRMQSAVDQAIANLGVIVFGFHDDLGAAGDIRSGFEATLAYLDTKRAQIDVLTEESLLRSVV